jgi:hypothetical protein
MAKTPEQMAAAMIANLAEKTGKDLDQWLAVVKKFGEAPHGQIVKRLKSEHGLTHGYANLVAHSFRNAGSGQPDDEALVDSQYSGAKAALRPVYEKLVSAVSKFGEDVVIAPKKSYVSLRRNKQFGLVQPSTRTRVDVGIHLPGRTATSRLETSGSFNAMVSHRVRLGDIDQVDAELIKWLKEAYDAS